MADGLTRRAVLRLGAGAVCAAVAGGLAFEPWEEAQGRRRPPGPSRRSGRIADIDRVVVVMQENRSFDHYFGTFPGVVGFHDAAARKLLVQRDGAGPGVGPWHIPTTGRTGCVPDPEHRWSSVHACWDEGRMDGFARVPGHAAVPFGPAPAMGYYQRRDLPFYFRLAQAFTICDRHHAPVLGPSHPNQVFALSASIDPDGRHGGPLIDDVPPGSRPHFGWTTMLEQLAARGVEWRIYSGQGRDDFTNVLFGFSAIRRRRRLAGAASHRFPRDFFADVRDGALPPVSWVFAPMASSEHPGASSVHAGQAMVAQVLQALTADERRWARTAVFVTWDEAGGFYDHVAPPVPAPGTRGEFLAGARLPASAQGVRGPVGLGLRVGLLVVSPFSRGGFVCSEVFDHSSILRFLEVRFGAEVPHLSRWRRAATGDLTAAFDFAHPDASVPAWLRDERAAPASAGPAACAATAVAGSPSRLPRQEPGRPRRPSGPV
ncbi:phospholipase C [Capillimicrobium parvum]|uniref:phospholipase C n=1 Tax=Capillimicrobium parvum TaxID=2884022 RepID=A0A9E6XZC5_9ACTN|nr:alkaline phosphatase family protein [Capillimicrobium parvum]UGS37250.1 Phospholipase C 2 [Capillimicrobium parvum]